MEHKYVSKLRKIVQKEFDVDIYLNEGLWFPTLEFLKKFQIPYKYGKNIHVYYFRYNLLSLIF